MPSLLGDAGCKFINSFVLDIQWLEECVCVCVCVRALRVLMSNNIAWGILFVPAKLLAHSPRFKPPTFFSLLVCFCFVLPFVLFCLFRFLMTMLVVSYSLLFDATTPQWARSSFTRFLDHTRRRTTVSSIPLDEWSARRRGLYLITHNTHSRQTSMPSEGFEPTVPAGERPQTYTLDRAATGTGSWVL